MPREFTPKIITANAPLEGDILYLKEDGNWTRHLAEAEILTDEADAILRLLIAQGHASGVTDAHLTEMVG